MFQSSVVLLFFVAILFISSNAWSRSPISIRRNYWLLSSKALASKSVSCHRSTSFLKMTNDNHVEEDWRDFRARLVAQEQKEAATANKDSSSASAIATNDDVTSSSTTTWAYEMGDVIEEGSVILSRHEHDFCYGLKQQYFHKSIMLVLEHEEEGGTNGIILNRPTSRVLKDNDGNEWKIWFGGPVRGIGDVLAEGEKLAFTCLHALRNDVAKRLSNKIIKDIQWTSLDTAQFLVRQKHAVPQDFQVYCGFAGWSPGQLQKELERKNWYMASVDSQTILQELLNQGKDDELNIDSFGLETWRRFAERIGRVNDTTIEAAERFDDCMLLEWIRAKLMTNEEDDDDDVPPLPPTRAPGTVLRACRPFLLNSQEFHKSLLLVLEDTPNALIGVLLNLPGADCVTIEEETLSIRHGGKYGVKGEPVKPVTWYHSSEVLREAKVGHALGTSGIWSCTRQDAETAIEMGLASLEDFLVVQGATVLQKKNGDLESLEALEKFQVVPRSRVPQVWDALLEQEGVTKESLSEYIDVARSVWEVSADDDKDSLGDANNGDDLSEKDDLYSVAWKSWVCTFVLRDSSLRGS